MPKVYFNTRIKYFKHSREKLLIFYILSICIKPIQLKANKGFIKKKQKKN